MIGYVEKQTKGKYGNRIYARDRYGRNKDKSKEENKKR